jgi:hypothetical protein
MLESPGAGKAQKRIGMALLIIGSLLSLPVAAVPAEGMGDSPVINFLFYGRWLVTLPTAMLGAFLFFRGRQYAARAIAETILGDSNPDVLYLRDFQTDPSIIRHVASTLGVFFDLRLPMLTSEEEQLAEVLKPFGELVAIGRPGERLPKPGAARRYVPDEEWKDVVTEQMRSARLVVIRAGSGEGLLWELKQAVALLNPQKLLILVLDMRKKSYEAFCEVANLTFPVPLPKSAAVKQGNRISGFFTFSADWKPVFLPLRAPILKGSSFKPYRAPYLFALRPVFEDSGLEWKRPRSTVRTITLALGTFILVILLAVSC